MSPRRGQEHKRQQRRADAARDAELMSLTGDYVPPPREECSSSEAYWPWGGSGLIRIEAWKWATNTGLADFALQASAVDYASVAWNTVVLARIDICHGHAHAHVMYPVEHPDVVHIRRIDHQSEVQEAYRSAIDMIQAIADRLDNERNAP